MENAIKQCSHCLEYHNTKLQEKTTPYEIMAKPLEVVSADIFVTNNINWLCIVDCYRKFPVVKQ